MPENPEGQNAEDTLETKPHKPRKHGRRISKRLAVALLVVAVLVLVPLAYAAYAYTTTPAVIRKPRLEHYHFRMQIIVDGQAQDFSSQAYQTGYSKDQCTADLPSQPIHFHDNKDQFVHIHWEGITGGMVMKYYGWNYIGGMDGMLGYRADKLTDPHKVPIHVKVLPSVPKDATFYVYSGNEESYQEKSFDDWVHQDLEQFFNKTSNFPAHNVNKGIISWTDKLFPKAYAHGTADDADGDDGTETAAEKLTRVNNLLGNVVIFVQKDKPTDQQVQDRFTHLLPLSESTCGG